MNAELEALLRETGDWDRLQENAWWPGLVRAMQRVAPGLQEFTLAANVLRESNGNPKAQGDNGSSHGLFQINVDAGLGMELARKHGRDYAIRYAQDPLRAGILMAREARARNIHLIPDPLLQCFRFTVEVERPAADVVQRVRRQLFGTEERG